MYFMNTGKGFLFSSFEVRIIKYIYFLCRMLPVLDGDQTKWPTTTSLYIPHTFQPCFDSVVPTKHF